MKTNFFETIASLNVPGKWNLSIHTDEKGAFTVSALYTALQNGDNASKLIPPMLLKGTAQELDEGFFEAIAEPVQQTAGLFQNMEAYLKGLEEAKKASKMEQDKKAKTVKPKTEGANGETDDIEVAEPKPNKEEKKKAYEEAMKRVAQFNDTCKYAEAIAELPSVEEYPEKKTELDKKLADLTRKKEQMAHAMQLFEQA
jgi:PRTRC genetic system protein E